MPTHTVEQGDHMSGIAEKYGFQSLDTIWNDPNNADLKKLRKDPHILFPGDQVFVPPLSVKSQPAPTTKLSTFTITIKLLRLNLKLLDINGDPIASKPVTIEVEGVTVPPPTTDGDGKTTSVILKSAKNGVLGLGDLQFPLKVGHLDPVEKQTGQIARLNNLGYEAGETSTIDLDAFQSAVEEFQCDNGIKPVTGNCDAATQAKLKDVHGC
jgi:Putative peptidoglycan binding domain